jgi:intracellular sulfur oxidation DsrE/DsrF family protein
MKHALPALLGFLIASASALAAPAPELSVPPEPAFTEHRVGLQISDAGDAKQTLILNVAANLLKAFGPDKVAIDIVAFGPGIDLLRAGNENAHRIADLIKQGVHFDACNNTIETIERNTGKPFPLNPQARRVLAGVPELVILSEHGYTVIRP